MSAGPKKQRAEGGVERGSFVFSCLFCLLFLTIKKVRPVRPGQKQKDGSWLVVWYFSQEVFQFLNRIIQSNEPTCLSADADSEENILCGYRVLEYIAPVMLDFPLPVDEFGELEIDDYEAGLAVVRTWMAQQDGEYELVMDRY